ncbi:MAG: divergent polysaccharide deacetylase family protein [Desulforhopalus sp.]
MEIVQEPDLPKVAIIIDDMGYHESIGTDLLECPFELTYSFLPFAPHTKKLEWMAYLSGKTIFLHLPLQPKGDEWNPGPGALALEDSPETQKTKFEKCFEQVPHAVGVNNHMGSLYTENEVAMTILLKEISDRNLCFVDSYTSSGSLGLRIAQELEVKSARRHVFLDNILEQEKICAQFEKLVNIAEKYGVGIGIAHPHQVTADAISFCGETYKSRVRYVSVMDVLY